jgi:hypothetical protein
LKTSWKIYKVLLIGKSCGADHIFLNVCISLDESLPPIVSEENRKCQDKIFLVEKTKQKNQDYLSKIKASHYFKTSVIMNTSNIKKSNETISDLNTNFLEKGKSTNLKNEKNEKKEKSARNERNEKEKENNIDKTFNKLDAVLEKLSKKIH